MNGTGVDIDVSVFKQCLAFHAATVTRCVIDVLIVSFSFDQLHRMLSANYENAKNIKIIVSRVKEGL